MVTSSKVQFNLETLKSKALKAIDEQIADAEAHVSSFDDVIEAANRLENWYEEQKTRVDELASRLREGLTTYEELAQFKISSMPVVNEYEKSRAERMLRELYSTRSQIVAKSGSLVADELGNIQLTKTQLKEFFAL